MSLAVVRCNHCETDYQGVEGSYYPRETTELPEKYYREVYCLLINRNVPNRALAGTIGAEANSLRL